MALLHRQTDTPSDQPDASSQSFDSSKSPGHRNFVRTSLRVTGPLLVVGACTAVAIAAGNTGTPATLHTQAKVTTPNTNAQVTVTQDASQQPQSASSSSSQASPKPTTHSYSVTNQGDSSAQLTVNGQQVTVPPNSTVQQTYTSSDGSSSLNMSTSTQATGDANAYSSTSIDVSNNSWSNGGGSTHTYTNGVPMQ